MRFSNLLFVFSTAVAALSVDPGHVEDTRAVEVRALSLTTLYTTSTICKKQMALVPTVSWPEC